MNGFNGQFPCRRLYLPGFAEHWEGARLAVIEAARQAFQRRHIVIADLEIYSGIAAHVIDVGRLGQRKQAKLQAVADAELGDADAISSGDPAQVRIA